MIISDWSSDVCSSDLGRLREKSQISRILRCKGFCVRYGFDKRHCAFGNLPKCANDLWMSAMADEHDVPSGFHLPLGLTMHLGHERAGGVQIGKTPRLSCGRHRSEEHTSELQSLM